MRINTESSSKHDPVFLAKMDGKVKILLDIDEVLSAGELEMLNQAA